MVMPSLHKQRLHLLRPYWRRLALGFVFMALAVVVQLAYPRALSYFIDHVGKMQQPGWFNQLALLILAIVLLQAIATTMRYYLFESAGYQIVSDVRQKVYAALIRQSIAYHDKHHVGELTSRLAADVELLHHTLTMGLAIALRCACVVLGSAILLLQISPLLSLVLILFIPLSLLMSHRAGKKFQQQSRDIQRAQADCGKVAHEHFTHIRLVHAFNQQSTALMRYANACAQALRVAVHSTKFLALYRGFSSLLLYSALLLTLWLGARLIEQGVLSVGELTGFVLYAGMLAESASAISDFWSDWMRALGASEKIFEMMEQAPPALPTPSACVDELHTISFDAVSFSYPERNETQALREISFKLRQGEKVAVVGASGAGKSTIASLMLGFYQPDSGRICYNGQYNTRDDIASLRERIAIVEQEPALFSGSLFENIAFAIHHRRVSREEVIEAAKLAHADDFIQGFPDGYDTQVGERGVQLSGGQKQRIAIARALLRDPSILILDEATSALDAASETQVQQALDRLMRGRTALIIAHRFSTIANADRVLVLDQGALVQQGTHAELMRQNDGRYHALMQHQIHRQQSATQESHNALPA